LEIESLDLDYNMKKTFKKKNHKIQVIMQFPINENANIGDLKDLKFGEDNN
jgi:hypothetical protein